MMCPYSGGTYLDSPELCPAIRELLKLLLELPGALKRPFCAAQEGVLVRSLCPQHPFVKLPDHFLAGRC
jgi:hypothetical protein